MEVFMKKMNLLNQRFGRLTVIGQEKSQGGKSAWKCLCDCGNITTVVSTNLTLGKIKSCGCIRREQITERNITHNLTKSKIYKVWKGIKQRCSNPKHPSYKNYGARGIRVCEEWKENFDGFYQWSIANGYIENKGNQKTNLLTIDRIDNDKNYSPDNCRWVDRATQARNKRGNKIIVYKGEKHCLIEWCEILNLSYRRTLGRLDKGWSAERAFETPLLRTHQGTH